MKIKIKPPIGWQNPKNAQMVVSHFKKYGADLDLTIKDGVVEHGVLSLPDEPPAMPDEKDESEGAMEARKEIQRIRKLNDLPRFYHWEVVNE